MMAVSRAMIATAVPAGTTVLRTEGFATMDAVWNADPTMIAAARRDIVSQISAGHVSQATRALVVTVKNVQRLEVA
jgi:hypothetical protein